MQQHGFKQAKTSTFTHHYTVIHDECNVPSIFECINARAEAIKAAKWAAYQPLTKQQLSTRSRRRDLEQNPETLTVDAGVFGKFVIVTRPTETAALRWTPRQAVIVQRRPTTQQRWCIWCKCRHPEKEFIRSPRYLHHLSYACKTSHREMMRRPWKFIA